MRMTTLPRARAKMEKARRERAKARASVLPWM